MERELNVDRAIYIISVAAELAGMHPQTLRIYERKGLLNPKRTQGNTRRYSERDIAQLRKIQELTQQGINLAGVLRIIRLEEEYEDLQSRYQAALAGLQVLEERMQTSEVAHDRHSMVLFKDVRRIRRAMKADQVDQAGVRRTFPLPPISIR